MKRLTNAAAMPAATGEMLLPCMDPNAPCSGEGVPAAQFLQLAAARSWLSVPEAAERHVGQSQIASP